MLINCRECKARVSDEAKRCPDVAAEHLPRASIRRKALRSTSAS
jgi:hypothetical protein